MNKKVDSKIKEVVYDDQEDREINEVAHYKSSAQQMLLLSVLVVLFGFTFFTAVTYIIDYYKNQNNKEVEVLEVTNLKNNLLITNHGGIDRTISEDDLKDTKKIIIEKVNTIEFSTNKGALQDGNITFDVKYNILENTFKHYPISKNNSDLMVRFSYSYDNQNWTYINNVISTTNSTINPLMNSYYDISGIVDNLKVVTNYNISSKPGEKTTMYWKSETIIQNKSNNLKNNIKANFKIEYKDND